MLADMEQAELIPPYGNSLVNLIAQLEDEADLREYAGHLPTLDTLEKTAEENARRILGHLISRALCNLCTHRKDTFNAFGPWQS